MFSKRNSRLPLPAAMDFESRRRILYPGSCSRVLIAVCLLWAGNLSAQEIAISYPGLAGDSVSALSAVAAGADIVLLSSAKNMLPYVFAVSKDIKRFQEIRGKVVGISQIGGRAGEIARMVIKNSGL